MSGTFTGTSRTRAELEALDKGFDYGTARLVELLDAAAAHLRSEADFNRSWADGRRQCDNETVRAKRLEFAAERDAWADAIAQAPAMLAALETIEAMLTEAYNHAKNRGEDHAAGHFDQIRDIAKSALLMEKVE